MFWIRILIIITYHRWVFREYVPSFRSLWVIDHQTFVQQLINEAHEAYQLQLNLILKHLLHHCQLVWELGTMTHQKVASKESSDLREEWAWRDGSREINDYKNSSIWKPFLKMQNQIYLIQSMTQILSVNCSSMMFSIVQIDCEPSQIFVIQNWHQIISSKAWNKIGSILFDLDTRLIPSIANNGETSSQFTAIVSITKVFILKSFIM